MFESLLVIAIYLTGVFTPVLIPASIHAVHVVRDGQLTFPSRLKVRLPRPTRSHRVAVPATA